jgi:hypothetical protein
MKNYWFKPKLYGFGAVPVTWQGWTVVIVYIVALLGVTSTLGQTKPFATAVIAVLMTGALVVISWIKTEGGMRWRWGRD